MKRAAVSADGETIAVHNSLTCRSTVDRSWSAWAFRWRKLLDTGVHATLEDLARDKGVNATCVSRMLRPTLLAPEIVEAILDGRQPVGLGLYDLLEGFPLEWSTQAEMFGRGSKAI